jgi:hypothetical protein
MFRAKYRLGFYDTVSALSTANSRVFMLMPRMLQQYGYDRKYKYKKYSLKLKQIKYFFKE